MTYSYDGWNYFVVFEKGEELVSGLKQFLKEFDIKGGWLNCIGGALEVELGYYDLEKHEYQWTTFAQLCEITSMQGNISRDTKDEVALHLHGNVADETYQAIGGHVNRLIVGGTCEVFIHPFRQPLERQFDDQTGLKLLHL